MDLNKLKVPNCHLWSAITDTGGLIQCLVPFGEDPKEWLKEAGEDDYVHLNDWKKVGEIHACTILGMLSKVNKY